MEIVTGEQMRRIDRRAIERIGVPSLELMEAAGRGVAAALLTDEPDLTRRPVVVLCGKGNNGGDGLVVARHLAACGARPAVFLIARAEELSGDAAVNLRRAREAGLEVREAPLESDWEELSALLERRPLVVDALLGTGVRGGARGPLARLIERLNASHAHVAAVDLPSGLDADSSKLRGLAVRADRTYALCRPKLALVLPPAARRAGRLHVVPIGIPDDAVRAEGIDLEWTDSAAVAGLVPARAADSHKGRFGHLLAIAGSTGKSGAAVLVARGALRTGVGLVTVATAESARPFVAVQQAEVMTATLAERDGGELARGAVDAALALAAASDALAIGPGLGSGGETREAVRAIVERHRGAVVIDADGLNALAPLDACPASAPELLPHRVLTPHPGEAARLLGTSPVEVQADRLAAVREIARRSAAVVVLKGERSLVAANDGRVAVNSSGNPGMATAGTGDVLTGVVGALLARGLTGWDAARLAVFVHGAAGDLAAAERGADGMIASDLVDRLAATLAALAPTPGEDG